jgi:chitinase
MKEDFANNLGLGGLMVWALDLDDPNSSSSLDNLALNGLRTIGDAVDANPVYAAQKLAATMVQNDVSLAVFWTDCSPNPICPDGFNQIATGHGKVKTTLQRQVRLECGT